MTKLRFILTGLALALVALFGSTGVTSAQDDDSLDLDTAIEADVEDNLNVNVEDTVDVGDVNANVLSGILNDNNILSGIDLL